MTSRLFDLNPEFLHFLEPFAAWKERRSSERSLAADVDFMERLVDCKLTAEEVYSVVTQGVSVPSDLKSQRMPSTSAADALAGLCAGRHIAVKTIRLSSLSPLCELQRRLKTRGDKVYVVDSYRDPRAVVASLMESGHSALSKIPENQRIKKMSESACQHMAARFQASTNQCRTLSTYSLQNEHFFRDPVTEGNKLYGFIGLEMPSEVRDALVAKARAPVAARGDGANATEEDQPGKPMPREEMEEEAPKAPSWSGSMSKAQAQQVQGVCQRIMPKELFRMVFVD